MWCKVFLRVSVGAALAAAFPGAARAGGLADDLAKDVMASSSGWSFDGGPYGWAIWMQGDMTARDRKFDVYADPVDLIDALDGPIIMANFEARKGRFSLYADVFYADVFYADQGLDSDFAAEAEPIPALQLRDDGRIGSELDFAVYQADAFYQVADFVGPGGGKTTFELGGGARYVDFELDVRAKIDLSARLQLTKAIDRIERRIRRIENEEDRLESLAQLNAVRASVLDKRIVRAGDKGREKQVRRLERRLGKVDERGRAIAALEAIDALRLGLLRAELNLADSEFNDSFATVSSGNMNFVDPVIAMRINHDLGNGQSITAMGDFGGFNINDGLSWQAVLTYDREGTLFGFETTTSVGYRALWLQYEEETSKGTRGLDIVLHGPIAELAFRW